MLWSLSSHLGKFRSFIETFSSSCSIGDEGGRYKDQKQIGSGLTRRHSIAQSKLVSPTVSGIVLDRTHVKHFGYKSAFQVRILLYDNFICFFF